MNHMEKLPEEIRQIVLLLEATGFRISDTCALKIDCLIQREDGWWITGEQRKVKDKTHRVPISEEIAKVVLTQQRINKKEINFRNKSIKLLISDLWWDKKRSTHFKGKCSK